ncbi:formyltransferase family protein [Pseudomonas sp. NFACC08-1]|uniref:formyltransferase family protein n=1 Tax=Pseudomonas sp. NFACC08-1 TaxID=1566238 RepID=UPI00089D5206|nr:formyltransferase family protein [Pseudomonas sp. NFACC08-1]SDX22395.1 methionyl-tRNA formyltransferase [Pseudomonas sp. NFACC08-1]
MKITILCNSEKHPVNFMLARWIQSYTEQHDIILARSKSELIGGDILFLVSCGEIIGSEERDKFQKVLVIHASDLPKGRGWSPHIWAIIEGADEITVTLLEAEDKVDSGHIWKKINVEVPKHALCHEINESLFAAEYELMSFAVEQFQWVKPAPQPDMASTYYSRREPKDSELDPEGSIASQFDLIRVSDPDRFPAFFNMHGHTYKLTIEKIKK